MMSTFKQAVVSVIIPCFNSEASLETAVLSAARNDRVLEILIVDDGSRDNSLAIAKSLEVQFPWKVLVIRHEDGGNHGAGASRNLGLEKAKGKYIAFLDSDDYFLPNRFDRAVDELDKNISIDGIYESVGTQFETREENFLGRVLTRSEGEQIITGIKSKVEPGELFTALLMGTTNGHIHTDGITLRKSLFEKVGYFDRSLELHQDSHYWIRAAFHGRLTGLDPQKVVAIRRVHAGNRIKNANLASQSKLYEQLLVYLSVEQLDLNQRFLLSLRAAMFSNRRRFSKSGQFTKRAELCLLLIVKFSRSIAIRLSPIKR